MAKKLSRQYYIDALNMAREAGVRAARLLAEYEVTCPVNLSADNTVIDDGGAAHTLYWSQGEPMQHYEVNESMRTWVLGTSPAWCVAGDNWFRANCPTDRFITKDGQLLKFRMNEEGEAEAFQVRAKLARTSGHAAAIMTEDHEGLAEALLRFRKSSIITGYIHHERPPTIKTEGTVEGFLEFTCHEGAKVRIEGDMAAVRITINGESDPQ